MKSSEKNLRFGLFDPKDMLAKARREIKRLEIASVEEASDHAMNAALTISHLADWSFRAAVKKNLLLDSKKEWGDFAAAARREDQCTAILTDVSNATKHFNVDQPKSDAVAVVAGPVVYIDDFTFMSFSYPTAPVGGKIRVRTIIDDDEIIGFETIVDGYRIETPSGPKQFENICNRAIEFWERTILGIEDGRLPEWLNH